MAFALAPLVLASAWAAAPPPPPKDPWAPVREQLDGWQFTDDFAVTVGNASGPLFQYTHGNMT